MTTFRFLARFSTTILFLGLLGCWEPVANKWAVKNIQTFFVDPSLNGYDEVGEITGDSLFFHLQIDPAFVYAQNHLSQPFMQNAMALSLPEPGRDGIFEDIVSIQFYCNKDLAGIPAGEPINSLVGLKSFNWQNFSSTEINGIPAIDYWLLQMNHKQPGASYFNYDGQTFFIAQTEHPADSVQISLRLATFRQVFECSSRYIQWN